MSGVMELSHSAYLGSMQEYPCGLGCGVELVSSSRVTTSLRIQIGMVFILYSSPLNQIVIINLCEDFVVVIIQQAIKQTNTGGIIIQSET
jgi:hypothetical protein